jgi:DNA replication protein DnaC
MLLDEFAEATLDGTRKECMEFLEAVPLLIIDDLGNAPAALDRRRRTAGDHHETIRTDQHSVDIQRPVRDWGKLLGDSAAVSAMLDRFLYHGHVLKCGPRSWRTKLGARKQ